MEWPHGRFPVGRRHRPHDEECLFFSSFPSVLVFFNCYCSDPEVRANSLKSFLLNGISLLSIYVFDLLLHPLSLSRGEEDVEGARLQSQNGLHRSIGWLYRILWLLPVVGVALYLNVRNNFFLLLLSLPH